MTSQPFFNRMGEPARLPKPKPPAFIDAALILVALGSGAMIFLALPNIIGGDGWWAYAKALILGLTATGISFAVNKLAVERGALLAVTGYWGAGITSIATILAVGGGLFAATYSGLVYKPVAELQVQEHGAALSVFVGERSASASRAASAGPAVRAIVSDLDQKLACEIAESCISGRGKGGNGPVARVVQEYAGRAASIAAQVAAGDESRQQMVARLNARLADYQTTLGNGERDIWERSAELQVIDARIGQDLGALAQATPLALLSAYAAELQSGVSLPERPEAEARLNGMLGRHGASLAAVIGAISSDMAMPPVFPRRTGVSDTFGYLAHFLPLAAIAAVVELIFPLAFWLYTAWALAWEAYKLDARASAGRTFAFSEIDPANRPRPNGRADRRGDDDPIA